ncbi:MAG: 1-acyl-sn-glycerol-3-phosphate acyltransferase [Pseudomonadota bacterium]|nr:1-acyl-sn-glycerol-3-phosphate acyltransferase [Pseudomonadota bacterium]
MKRAVAALTGLARCALLCLLLVELGLLSLAWNLVAPLLHRLLTPQRGAALGRVAIARIYGTLWRTAQWLGVMQIDAGGLETLADEPGGLIVAANHPTMFDALIVVSRLQRGVCIMKAELMRNVFVGPGARLARYIRNDSPHGLVRGAVDCLRDGGQLVMFPEGTRTAARSLNPFRPGVTLIAQKAQVPIQTVIIETDSPYLRKGWPIWRAPAFPIVIRARLGDRFAPQADHQALLERIECYFIGELGQ